jgi:hypothetical protein
MKKPTLQLSCLPLIAGALLIVVNPGSAASAQVLGWNNLGMHCMDSDYSVFSILPPYNTIEAQLIVAGKLVTNGIGYTVTCQAVADPDGSPHDTNRNAAHSYAAFGNYSWSLMARVGAATATDSGTIVIGDTIRIGMLRQPLGGIVSWPRTTADAILEAAAELRDHTLWHASTNSVTTTPTTFEAEVTTPPTNEFFRLRQVR